MKFFMHNHGNSLITCVFKLSGDILELMVDFGANEQLFYQTTSKNYHVML